MDSRVVSSSCVNMPVDAVVADVDLAANEPFREADIVGLEDLVIGLEPMDSFGLFSPEGFRIFQGVCILLFILLTLKIVVADDVAAFCSVVLIVEVLGWILSIFCSDFLRSHEIGEAVIGL